VVASTFNDRESMAVVWAPAGGAAQPVTCESRIGDFWKMLGIELDDEEDALACAKITKDLKKNHGCISVGCMKGLPYITMKKIVCEHNGNREGWLHSIERLLEHKFERLAPSAPESACMALSTGSGYQQQRFVPKVKKLGHHLVRQGRMAEIALPFHTYHKYVVETENPEMNQLTSNDTRAVASEAFKYMACHWDYVAGDKLIFDHMSKETKKRYPRPYGPSGWAAIYRNRFKSGRSSKSEVRIEPPTAGHRVCSHHASPYCMFNLFIAQPLTPAEIVCQSNNRRR
jgi:hypothetical protein